MRTLVVNEHPHMLPFFETPLVAKQTSQNRYAAWLAPWKEAQALNEHQLWEIGLAGGAAAADLDESEG